MSDRLVTAIGKMPVYADISYRCLLADASTMPSAFVTVGLVPTLTQPAALLRVPDVRTIIAFLNRTARDVTALSASGPEVCVMPQSAFRAVMAVDFSRAVTVQVVEEIVEFDRPEPSWPRRADELMERIAAALSVPDPTGRDVTRYTGPFEFFSAAADGGAR